MPGCQVLAVLVAIIETIVLDQSPQRAKNGRQSFATLRLRWLGNDGQIGLDQFRDRGLVAFGVFFGPGDYLGVNA